MTEYIYYPELEDYKSLKNEIKEYVDRWSPRITNIQTYTNNIRGYFRFKHSRYEERTRNGETQTIKWARITMDMDTPLTEYLVGKYLLGECSDCELGVFNRLNEYSFGKYGLIQAYLRNVRFLNTAERQRTVRGREIRQVRNPETGRFIQANQRKFRELYSQMKMLGMYRELVGIDTIPYDNNYGSCFVSALYNEFNIKLSNRVLKNIFKTDKTIDDAFTLEDIMKVAEYKKLNIFCRTRTGEVIDKIQNKKSFKGKCLNFIIHDNHFYLCDDKYSKTYRDDYLKIKSNSPIYLENMEDIQGEYNTYITDNYDLFGEILEKNENKDDGFYDLDCFIYNNNKIRYNDLAKKICNIMSKYPTKMNMFSLIENMLDFKSIMNRDLIKLFFNIDPIRIYGADKCIVNINIDQNKSYYSQLLKNIKIPITNIDTDFSMYNDEEIKEYQFYNIEVKNTDIIIAPTKRFTCSGYTLLKLQKLDRVKKIYYVLKVDNYTKPDRDFVKSINNKCMNRYVGWLRKIQKQNVKRFSNISPTEYEALRYCYGDKSLSYDETNNVLTIIKYTATNKTGLLANIIVKELTNIDLYDKNQEILKLNKGLELKRVYVDCLGYYMEDKNDFIKPKLNKEIGGFKNENKTVKISKIQFLREEKEIVIKEKKELNKVEQKNILNILKNNQGLKLLGGPGYGKTYHIKNILIPYFNENNIKYKLYGATREISKALDTITFHKDIYGLCNLQIKRKYSDIDYILIDEASQLTQSIYCKLLYIKKVCNVNIILIGDEYQCRSIDAGDYDKSWLESNFCNELCDNNVVELEYHENGRYTKALDTILKLIKQYIKDNRNNPDYLLKLVLDNFKFGEDGEEVEDGIHIGYNRILNQVYKNVKTTHTAQGKTIDVPYYIYQIETQMIFRPRVLYTALSRARSIEQITLIRGEPYMPDLED